jgi:hypothetical protein
MKNTKYKIKKNYRKDTIPINFALTCTAHRGIMVPLRVNRPDEAGEDCSFKTVGISAGIGSFSISMSFC